MMANQKLSQYVDLTTAAYELLKKERTGPSITDAPEDVKALVLLLEERVNGSAPLKRVTHDGLVDVTPTHSCTRISRDDLNFAVDGINRVAAIVMANTELFKQ